MRKEDLELSGSDALAAFFSKLCYETKESQHRIFMNSRLNGFLAKLGQPACISLGEITDACRRFNFIVTQQERINSLEKAKNLYDYCLDKNDQACVLGFVDHHLSKEPEESDDVHDLLSFLAEERIRLNKKKRTAQKQFLNWLVTTLRILPNKEGREGIEVLTCKDKLAGYPGDYQKGESLLAFEELLDILQKNKGRLGVSLSDAGLVERARKEYEGSVEKVLP